MAQQTKNKTTRSSSGSRSRKRGSASSSNGRSAAARSRSNAKSRSSTAKRRSSTRRRPTSNDKSPVAAVKDTAVEGAKSAGDTVATTAKSAGGTVATTAKKLRTPAIAAGVGLAGLAGGIALGNRDRRRKVLGVPMPTKAGAQATSKNLASAAKQAGKVAERAGELAAEVRRMRESIDENGKRRSPIEVVLQGLTNRR